MQEENLNNEVLTQENESLTVGEQEENSNVVDENQPATDTNEPKDDLFNNEQQARINEMIRARLERQNNSFYKRYGVNDRDGLDSLIGKAQSYDIMKERYDSMSQENAQLKEKLAFMSNGINPDREDDIRAHFKGKGLEFDNDSLIKELETHPEWRKVVEAGDTTPKTTIERLGVEHRDRNVPETEAERQKRIFGV